MENYRKRYNEMCEEIGTSLKKAIRAMCYQCSGYDYSEVRNCNVKDCPLFIVKQNRANAPKRPAPANAFKKKNDDVELNEENE